MHQGDNLPALSQGDNLLVHSPPHAIEGIAMLGRGSGRRFFPSNRQMGIPLKFHGGAVSYNFDYSESAEKADALGEIAASA